MNSCHRRHRWSHENFSQCNFSCPSCRFGPCKSSFREKYFDQQCVRFSTGFVWYSPAKSRTGEQHKNCPVVVIMSFLARNVTRSLVQVSFILIVGTGKCLCNHPFAQSSLIDCGRCPWRWGERLYSLENVMFICPFQASCRGIHSTGTVQTPNVSKHGRYQWRC